MLSGAREAGCFREVAALHSGHLRQVPLYCFLICLCMYVCSCPTLAVTEMLVNVLNIHSEDDDDEPTEPGGEGGVRVRVRVRVG